MLKIFEPLDFKDAKPKRPQHTYIVQFGDTLAGIALRHGMKEAEVRAMNNLWEGNVFTGQELLLHRKKRSQSLPVLPGAKQFADTQRGRLGPNAEPAKLATRGNQATHLVDANPAMEDDEQAMRLPQLTMPRTSALHVIEEQQPHSGGLFDGWFGNSFNWGSASSVKKEKQEVAPRLKMRSYSERLPTNQEEQNDVYALPKLSGASTTDILSDGRQGPKLVPKIEAFLPMRLRGYNWNLLYSLSQHGSSLHTLMRKVRGERATLIVVETCNGEVFGAFVSSPWANSLSYYGSGESFVFTTAPTFEVFNWARTNTMFMYNNDQSIAMGGGGGFAWFMNSDLSRGTSSASETFGNRPLTTDVDFDVAHVEVWGFAMF